MENNMGAAATGLNENQKQVLESLDKTVKRVNGVLTECVTPTIDNFVTIFRNDHTFDSLLYNSLAHRPEKTGENDELEEWTASDDAWSRAYIEKTYGLYNNARWQDAFVMFQRERQQNPLLQKINAVKWDGKPRCAEFLSKWLKADNTAYNREVSRLLFAGGINRLCDPGCKYDCVPVLMGRQGSGKSTIVHWLAMDDRYYNSIGTIKGQKGAESILNVWVCEIEELLAITANGSNNDDLVKAFITKQDENYREPYAKRACHHPRQCIFVGTTNQETFLADKTGSRRWFPVKVHSDAHDLYDHEQDCKNDILQAWAEMYDAYQRKDSLASTVPDLDLYAAINKEREAAECDDPDIGFIERFLEDKTSVCIIQIWDQVLSPIYGRHRKPSQTERRALATILTNHFGWVRGGVENFGAYSKQKSFHRPDSTQGKIAAEQAA